MLINCNHRRAHWRVYAYSLTLCSKVKYFRSVAMQRMTTWPRATRVLSVSFIFPLARWLLYISSEEATVKLIVFNCSTNEKWAREIVVCLPSTTSDFSIAFLIVPQIRSKWKSIEGKSGLEQYNSFQPQPPSDWTRRRDASTECCESCSSLERPYSWVPFRNYTLVNLMHLTTILFNTKTESSCKYVSQ